MRTDPDRTIDVPLRQEPTDAGDGRLHRHPLQMPALSREPPIERHRPTDVEMGTEGPSVRLEQYIQGICANRLEGVRAVHLDGVGAQRHQVPVSGQDRIAEGPPQGMKRLSKRPTGPVG
jgi:hypothetical protein